MLRLRRRGPSGNIITVLCTLSELQRLQDAVEVQQMRQHLAQRDAQIALPLPWMSCQSCLPLRCHSQLAQGEADATKAASRPAGHQGTAFPALFHQGFDSKRRTSLQSLRFNPLYGLSDTMHDKHLGPQTKLRLRQLFAGIRRPLNPPLGSQIFPDRKH